MISVVTVCLNSRSLVREAIESVLNQTYDNTEYILIDGGSTDGTLDIIKEYEDQIAYWVSESDKGIFDAMNKGVALATGDLIGILNSDDRYPENALEEVARARLQDPDAQVYHGNAYIVDKDGEFIGRIQCSHEHLDCFWRMNHQTCFIEQGVYEKYHYPLNYKVSADYHLLLSLYMDGKRFHHINEPIAYFRLGGNSDTYYGHRRDIYKLRREFGLITLRRYLCRRFLLAFKAVFLSFKARIEKVLFPENEGFRRINRKLTGLKLGMEAEIKKASAHITHLERHIALMEEEKVRASVDIGMLERELSLKNVEIQRLSARGNNNGRTEITASSPAIAKFVFYMKNEGVRPTLVKIPEYIVRKVNNRHKGETIA